MKATAMNSDQQAPGPWGAIDQWCQSNAPGVSPKAGQEAMREAQQIADNLQSMHAELRRRPPLDMSPEAIEERRIEGWNNELDAIEADLSCSADLEIDDTDPETPTMRWRLSGTVAAAGADFGDALLVALLEQCGRLLAGNGQRAISYQTGGKRVTVTLDARTPLPFGVPGLKASIERERQTILHAKNTGGHRARPAWTRHAVDPSTGKTRCGLDGCTYGTTDDGPSVQGEVTNCKRCGLVGKAGAQ